MSDFKVEKLVESSNEGQLQREGVTNGELSVSQMKVRSNISNIKISSFELPEDGNGPPITKISEAVTSEAR